MEKYSPNSAAAEENRMQRCRIRSLTAAPMAGDSQARVSSLIKNTERYWKNMRNTVISSNLLSGSF
jgi:hypothetical protein